MASETAGLNYMKTAAIAIMVLAAVSLVAIAVITGFKNTGLVDNTTADKFISGIAYFGTFIGIIVLAIVGKILVGMFKGGM